MCVYVCIYIVRGVLKHVLRVVVVCIVRRSPLFDNVQGHGIIWQLALRQWRGRNNNNNKNNSVLCVDRRWCRGQWTHCIAPSDISYNIKNINNMIMAHYCPCTWDMNICLYNDLCRLSICMTNYIASQEN